MNESLIKSIDEYLNEFIEDYQARYSTALSYVNKYRCGIEQADYCLYNEIIKKIEEYCDEEKLCVEDIQEEIAFILF